MNKLLIIGLILTLQGCGFSSKGIVAIQTYCLNGGLETHWYHSKNYHVYGVDCDHRESVEKELKDAIKRHKSRFKS